MAGQTTDATGAVTLAPMMAAVLPIPTRQQLRLIANNSINFQPNFSIAEGARFEASIDQAINGQRRGAFDTIYTQKAIEIDNSTKEMPVGKNTFCIKTYPNPTSGLITGN